MKQFDITGMSCAACSARIEKAVSELEGVTTCSVSLLSNSMAVEGSASDNDIVLAVVSAGYGASLKGKAKVDKNNSLADKETLVLLKRLVCSLVFLVALMYVSMGHIMWGFPLPLHLAKNPLAIGLIQLLLTVIVMVINQKFFISGFKGLLHRAPNMDTLIALGSSSAFVYSTYVLFDMTNLMLKGDFAASMHHLHDLYFESAAMILTLITLGKLLEARSKGKTTDALKSLMNLSPKTATVLRGDGQEIISAEEVKKGDIFIVKPGESIPVDGIVIEGVSAVNEASLTGESIPVDKNVGDSVSAATINQSGFLKCKAVRVGEDTTLSQIIKMVENTAATKAPIAKIADKVSGIFVPVVISIAVITLIAWLLLDKSFGFSLARAISVLVISCPCALGLATPVAIMVSNGVGAKRGILFKTAESIEQTGRADIVILDKTGTVTKGKPQVTDIISAKGISDDELLYYAACLESKSEHPLSLAITEMVKQKSIDTVEVENFNAVIGKGLIAKLSGKMLVGGNFDYISTFVSVDLDIENKAGELSASGKTPLYFAFDGKLLGIIAVADTLKEDSCIAVSELGLMGIQTVMLTGDNEKTAKAIASQVGIENVVANLLPTDKERIVRDLKNQGTVIMVGDGINDAPALTQADVGIAIGAGTDVAMDAADVVLMKSNLLDLVYAIRLGKKTLRTIHQNLFWAFIYNVIGIPLAAGVFIAWLGWEMNPMFGAAAMSLSSFTVVMNALRINLFNIRAKSFLKKKGNKLNLKEKLKMELIIKVEGMMCMHCEAHVKKALESIDGVETAVTSHENGTAVVTLSKEVELETLKKAIIDAGYTVID